MKRLALGLALACATACGSEPGNPSRLWLYIDGGETEVKLVDQEPPDF